MTVDPWLIMRAGLVRRYHANPDLCHLTDTVAMHGARCKQLARWMWPDACEGLLWWCQYHDFGEYATGDIPFPVKQAMPPEVRAWFKAREDQALRALFRDVPELSETDAKRLKLVDQLDAYTWASTHAPHVLDGDGWPEARQWLEAAGIELGVSQFVRAVIR